MSLRVLVTHQAERVPEALAVKGPDGSLTYGELDRMANHFASVLAKAGVQAGDRVGLWLEKTTYAVAAMQGVLRLRAIYVPLDPLCPAARVHIIVQDCAIKVLVTTRKRAERTTIPDLQYVTCLYIDSTVSTDIFQSDLDMHLDNPVPVGDKIEPDENEIAYILYTSGSTGKPKGVCISHRNALAFIQWAADIIEATPHDRFANHAPFHFDLSVLDLYVAFAAGAMVFLIPDNIAYMPRPLVECVLKEKITVWYSVPSVLVLMMEQGNFLSIPALGLRIILFAGEPFPTKALRKLYQRWPHVRYLNLYGPTETNVCTFYELEHLAEELTSPVPIGKACSGDIVWAQREDGYVTQIGEVGELMVEGPTVMVGYWGQPKRDHGPYATGDLVRLQENGNYVYLGRHDHMVKVRGHRIELGEIEVVLEQHPAIHDAAVIIAGDEMEARIIAFVVPMSHDAPGLLAIKRHCAERLPRYMIVDELHCLPELPRTRNGKIDRMALVKASKDKKRRI